MDFQSDLIPFLLILFLTSVRFLGLLSSLIFFSGTSLPIPVKFWMSLTFAFACLPILQHTEVGVDEMLSVAGFVLFAGRELFIGLVLGTLTSSPLYALHMAGRFISQEMGFAMTEMLDPMSQQKVAVIGQLKYVLGTWFWFCLGGDLLMVRALAESLKILPLGTPLLSMLSVKGISAWINGIFLLSVKVILPYFGVLFLAEVGFGFMARMVPQMNIFMLGFPVKILLAMFLLSILAVPMIRGLIPIELGKFLRMASMLIGLR